MGKESKYGGGSVADAELKSGRGCVRQIDQVTWHAAKGVGVGDYVAGGRVNNFTSTHPQVPKLNCL